MAYWLRKKIHLTFQIQGIFQNYDVFTIDTNAAEPIDTVSIDFNFLLSEHSF